jgi:hypothetical protein
VIWQHYTAGSAAGWVSYSPAISDALEYASNFGLESTTFMQDGVQHTVSFKKLKVCRSDWPYILPSWAWSQRDVRRIERPHPKQSCMVISEDIADGEEGLLELFDSFSTWTTAPSTAPWLAEKADEVKLYEIPRSAALGSLELSRDLREFSFASMQFCRLLNKDPSAVNKVDAIVYEPLSSVARNYAMMKQRFAVAGKPTKELLVFHGTDETCTRQIICEGFKIGGADDGVGIKHGRCFGPGVYAATGPGTPAKYEFGGAGGRVILAVALVGSPAPPSMHSPHDAFDSFYPNNDSVVLKDGKQLLPLFVVYFNPPTPYDYY